MSDHGSFQASAAGAGCTDALAWYEALRNLNRPEVVRLLLVGESPPDPLSGERRFYEPTLRHDNLYRGVVETLYGDEPRFDIRAKAGNLQRLRSDGVWLIDAVDEPVNKRTMAARRKAIRDRRDSLVARCLAIKPTVGIVICHSVVFSETSGSLADAGLTVLHEHALPFPLGNTRARFVAGTRLALSRAGWFDDRPTNR